MAKKRLRVDVFVGIEHETKPQYRDSYKFEFSDTEGEIETIVTKLLEDIGDLWSEVELEDEEEGENED